jgi:lysophospholipase L1-like esterase
VLCTLSLVVVIALFEAYLRKVMKYKPDLHAYVEDFDLGKRLKPGYRGDHYGAYVEINRHGMRDREVERARPAGVRRIIALGDSWTFGTGVAQDETWPKRLEAELRAQGHAVEVVNTGVSGYETYHEALYYEQDLAAFEHDLVLVGTYPVNDIHSDLKRDRYERARWFRDHLPWAWAVYAWPSENLYAAHWWKQWRRERKQRLRAEHYREQAEPEGGAASAAAAPSAAGFASVEDDWTLLYEDAEDLQAMRDGYASIGRTARGAGARGAVVLFPDLRDLVRHRTYCLPRVGARLTGAITAGGLEVIDLAPDFAGYEGREAEISLGDNVGATHPNADGYALIGRWVAREVVARELLVKPQ